MGVVGRSGLVWLRNGWVWLGRSGWVWLGGVGGCGWEEWVGVVGRSGWVWLGGVGGCG